MKISVLVAIAVSVAISFVWYSPKLFCSKWSKALGFDMNEFKVTPLHYLGGVVVNALMVIAIAILTHLTHTTTLLGGLELGLILWVGFIASNHFSGVIWAKVPLVVYFINIGCLLVIILFNTVLFSLWKG